MNQQIGSSDWISAFLEWTENEFGVVGQSLAVSGMEAGDGWAEDSAAVFLEWLDSSPRRERRKAAVLAPEPLREAILLMALRTESECVHLLRQTLEDSQPSSQTLRLAMEALECAKTLLDDERRAWRALDALRPDARIAWNGASRTDWPGALESVEADMRALSGRILELRAH